MPPETPAGDREATLLAHLEAQPREANGHLELAFLYYQTARFEAAFEAIARSLALNSGAAAAYQLLGLILGALGQPAYAARAFEASLALEPDNETARHCLQACRQQPATGALPADRSARVERLLEARTPTLSACLIVKDEAENLPRCLESVRDWVSEIVVVDTGSTDGTVAIAESFGARVHHFDWCDDFSAARNFSLAHATGDWVLVIDADETLVVDDPAAFRWALHQRACAGYITVRHDWRSSEETDKVLVLRLFQRHARIRFAGHLHENVGTAIAELGWPIGQLETIALRHAGASEEAVNAKGKRERNLRVARAGTQAQPESLYAWHNLSCAAARMEADDEALAAFAKVEEGLARGETLGDIVFLKHVRFYHGLLCRLARRDDALALLDRALALYPGHAELHYLRGTMRASDGDTPGARADFTACLAPRPYLGVLLNGVDSELPRRALAELDGAPSASSKSRASDP